MKNGIVRLQFIRFVPLLLCPFEPMHQPAKRPGIRKPRKRNSTKDYVRIYKLFMQNKANFMRLSPENDDFTKKQTQLKPIQTQFNPKQSQFKPNKAKNKPNSNPTCHGVALSEAGLNSISKSRFGFIL